MSLPNRAFDGPPTLQPVCFRQNLALFLLLSTSAVPALNMTGFFQFWPMSMWFALPLSVLGGMVAGMLYAPPRTNCLLGILPGMLAGLGGLLTTYVYTYARETIYRFEGVFVWLFGVLPAGILYFLLLKLFYPSRRYPQSTAQPWPHGAMPGGAYHDPAADLVEAQTVATDVEPLRQFSPLANSPQFSGVSEQSYAKRSLWPLWVGGFVALGGALLLVVMVAALTNRLPMPAANLPVQGQAEPQAPTVVPAPAAPAPRARLSAVELEPLLTDLQAAELHRVMAAADRLANAVPDESQAERVGAALIERLNHENLFARRNVVAALGSWGTYEQLAWLVERLQDPDLAVRRTAMDALAARSYEAAAEPLAALLASHADRSRASAALQLLGASAEPVVLAQLTHQDQWVRMEACRILKEVGTQASSQALQQASGDRSPLVQRAAAEAMRAIAERGQP